MVLIVEEGVEAEVIRVSRLADYSIVVTTQLARHPQRSMSAVEIAAATHIPPPTASKVLKALVRADLLTSHRGARGGYGLARAAAEISVAEVIEALEGPIALTSCVENGGHDCGIEHLCQTRSSWHRINDAIRGALDGITLADMVTPSPTGLRLAGEATAAAGLPA